MRKNTAKFLALLLLFLLVFVVIGACAGLPESQKTDVAAQPLPETAGLSEPASSVQKLGSYTVKVFSSPYQETMKEIKAFDLAKVMGLGINLGNTLENTSSWETGWGQPHINQDLIQAIAAQGFTTVRVPVAWDTYARDGQISYEKLARVAEVVDWITQAGMYCVINIHWDGGWIDSSYVVHFDADVQNTFSGLAQNKFLAHWTQIATYFKGKNEQLIFESLNEESNFSQTEDPYITLAQVNQLFIDTVRATGGNNSTRTLIIAGYGTDFEKTSSDWYVLPEDTIADRLMISVHYYTPSPFTLLTEDATWGKMRSSWGTSWDYTELEDLFAAMAEFSANNKIPVFVGEYTVAWKKESAQRIKWIQAVTQKCLDLGFVPVLWDVGDDLKRRSPYTISDDLKAVLNNLEF